MPKDPTVPRTQTVTSAPKARAGASSVQPTRSFPPRTNNQPRSSNQRTQQGPAILPPRGPEKHPQDDESDLVHANCNTIFKKADQDRRQLTSQLRASADAARRGNSEKAQLQTKVRKLASEVNESKQKTQDLEKRLDEATLDSRNYVSRQEHEKTLRDLLGASSSVTKMIESGLSESHNAFVSTFMPDSDVAQVPFVDQSEQFGMLDNPVVPDITAPTFSISDPPLPDFDAYVAMQ